MELHRTTHGRSGRARRLGIVAIGVVAVALLVPPGAFADGAVQVEAPSLGTITSDPPGINCPSVCGASFTVDTVVLTAVGVNGYSLSRWEGCSGGEATAVPPTCEVDTPASTAITAFFDPADKLDVSPQGPGSVQATVDGATGEGVARFGDPSSGPGECSDVADSQGDAHCILSYLPGRVVTLTATPDPGEPFMGWGRSDCPATSLTCVIAMKSDHESVAPLFGATGTLHVLLGGAGVVTSSPAGLADNGTGDPLPCASASNRDSAGPTCDLTAPLLAPVRLTVMPGNAHASIVWSPRCDVPIGDPATCIVTMGGAEWISVSIGAVQPPQGSPPGYDVLFTVSHTGSGTVRGSHLDCGSTCSALYPFGVHESLVANADPGFHFVTWRGACATTTTCSLWVGPTTSLLAVFDADQATAGQSQGESKAKGSDPKLGRARVQLAARMLQLRQVGHRRGRALVVRLSVNEAANLRVTFQGAHARAIWSFKLRPGSQTVRIPVSRATRAGLGRLVLKLTDASGNQQTLKRSLRLRR